MALSKYPCSINTLPLIVPQNRANAADNYYCLDSRWNVGSSTIRSSINGGMDFSAKIIGCSFYSRLGEAQSVHQGLYRLSKLKNILELITSWADKTASFLLIVDILLPSTFLIFLFIYNDLRIGSIRIIFTNYQNALIRCYPIVSCYYLLLSCYLNISCHHLTVSRSPLENVYVRLIWSLHALSPVISSIYLQCQAYEFCNHLFFKPAFSLYFRNAHIHYLDSITASTPAMKGCPLS